ncbi:MAG TPA: hypothetical protein VLB73_03890 [Patescibacteria group bacterium]|nr:hypothetical protein [Patescibacteria group bacterium]
MAISIDRSGAERVHGVAQSATTRKEGWLARIRRERAERRHIAATSNDGTDQRYNMYGGGGSPISRSSQRGASGDSTPRS